MGYKILGTLLLSLISAQALAIKYVVLEGDKICQFYQEPKGCYQQALQMISSAANVGTFQNKNKECLFQNGDKAIFNKDVSWMLSKDQSMQDLYFEIFSASGDRKLTFKSDGRKSFSIQGPNSEGIELSMSFTEMENTSNGILGTVKCNMNFGTGEVVYILTSEQLYEASKACPSVIGKTLVGIPNVYYERAQVYQKIQAHLYITRSLGSGKWTDEVDLFKCRNY